MQPGKFVDEMLKRKYPSSIDQTSGAFRRAIERKRGKYTIHKRNIAAGAGPVINLTRRSGFPRLYNQPMPQSLITTLRYTDYLSINPGVSTAGTYAFVANGLWDPNFSGTGHQPMGFDQMMTFYNHFEVIGSKIKFSIYPGPEVTGFNWGVKLDDSGTFSNVAHDVVIEHAMTNYKTHPGGGLSNGFDITCSFSSKKFFGDRAGDRETWGTAAANPAEMAYFICFIAGITPLQDIGSIPGFVCIEYITKFHEPKDFSPS